MKLYDRFHHKFGWCEKSNWLYPAGDLSTPVHFDIVTKETTALLEYVTKDDICIQAGGNIGLWPYRYSKFFRQVATFEPCEENLHCLRVNLDRVHNATIFPYALGDVNEMVTVKHISRKPISYGARYVEPDVEGDAIQVRLDDQTFDGSVDFLHLDIEGRELFALKGAEKTIEEHQPVIALEHHTLQQMTVPVDAASEWLVARGYEIVAKFKFEWVFKHV